MNKQELSQFLSVTERTIEKEFPKLQKQLALKGKILNKKGRGSKAEYYISTTQSIYDIQQTIYLSDEIISLSDFSMLVAIGMTLEPETFNHKSYKEFLVFLEMTNNTKNINLLKRALEYLDFNKFITYKEDTSNKNYFMATWSIELKKQYRTQMQLLPYFKALTTQYKKSDKYIILLLKTWIGINIIKGETITKKVFCDRFNLSQYQFDECKNILLNHNLINLEIVKHKIHKDNNKIIGTKYFINILNNIPTVVKE